MKVFRQDPWPDDREPYVFAEGVVNLKYPVGLFAVQPYLAINSSWRI